MNKIKTTSAYKISFISDEELLSKYLKYRKFQFFYMGGIFALVTTYFITIAIKGQQPNPILLLVIAINFISAIINKFDLTIIQYEFGKRQNLVNQSSGTANAVR